MRREKKITELLIFVTALLAVSFMKVGAQSNPSPSAASCPCRVFTVASNLDAVRAGDVVEFRIDSTDPAVLRRSFKWEVSEGEIVAGQGTPVLKVKTPATRPQTSPIPGNSVLSGVFISTSGPRWPLKVTAKMLGSGDCGCAPAGLTIGIGPRSIPRNLPAQLTELDLNPDNLVLPCRPGTQPGQGVVPSASMVINVLSSAQDPEHDVISYHYTVSGGRVVGAGRRVKWDLDGVAPGSYTITAGADDGCGICGQTQTRTLTVTECEAACSFCECPTISIAAPESAEPGWGARPRRERIGRDTEISHVPMGGGKWGDLEWPGHPGRDD